MGAVRSDVNSVVAWTLYASHYDGFDSGSNKALSTEQLIAADLLRPLSATCSFVVRKHLDSCAATFSTLFPLSVLQDVQLNTTFNVKRSKVKVTRPLWLVVLAGQHLVIQ